MASLHLRESSGKYQVAFRWGGKLYSRCTGTNLKKDAQIVRRTVEQTIWRMDHEALTCPAGVKVQDFIFSGGTLTGDVMVVRTLGESIDRYVGSLRDGAMQKSTLEGPLIRRSEAYPNSMV